MQLHNKLVELKGNIRVFAKIRPTLSHDHDAAGNEAVKAVDNVAVEAMVQGTPREFEYDFVFAPGLSPDRVFEEVSPLVTSFVDGFNVCVLAYGQTGSGKTFTMLGPSAIDGESAGASNHNPVYLSEAFLELFELLTSSNPCHSFRGVLFFMVPLGTD